MEWNKCLVSNAGGSMTSWANTDKASYHVVCAEDKTWTLWFHCGDRRLKFEGFVNSGFAKEAADRLEMIVSQ